MKRMIRSAEQLNNIFDQKFYCNYAVNDPTWEADITTILEGVGGVKAYVSLRDDRSKYPAKWYYLFPSLKAAGQFEDILEEKDLLDFVDLSNINPVKAVENEGKTIVVY